MITDKPTQNIVTILWVLGGALVGLFISVILHTVPVLSFVLWLVGAIIAAAVRGDVLTGRRQKRVLLLSEGAYTLLPAKTGAAVGSNAEEILKGEEARMWLDDFLVEQQTKF
ncbi:MAG: hypothetical protein U1C49_01945 [Candidatus Andersenbacteria bacterium]|nr:hypothetical protein [bacterium]MDZ4225588.1 hypothetical protein [Candidatus Andersenbacteria bacterium]